MKAIVAQFAVILGGFTLPFLAQAKPILLPLPYGVESGLAGPYNFLGTVKLSGCSGSLVRFASSADSDPGLVMTNGHCVGGTFGGMMAANTYQVHQPANRSFQFLNPDGTLMSGSVRATELVYGTITWNDIAFYALELNYAEIQKRFGVPAFLIDSKRPGLGESIEVLSGYWQRGYSCKIDRFVFELHEAEYVSKDSMRYSKGGCETIHGTSGSPVIVAGTRRVVGINSTGNDSGERCTMNNPCEVSENGQVYVERGRSYADQTWVVTTCLDSRSRIDVKVPGCLLYH